MPSYEALKNKQTELIRKALDGSVFVADISADPIADLTKYFPLGSVSFVIHFGDTGALLPSPLQIHYCPTAFQARSPCNKAISTMVRNLPRAYSTWAGWVVVMKFSDHTCRSYTDFSFTDIAHVRAFFACAA